MKNFYFLYLVLFLFTVNIFPQQQYDSTANKHINYRRTADNHLPTSYYQQPKEQVFPLGYGTKHLGKVTAGTGVWTELNPKVPRVDYLGIGFANKDTGWAVGANGALIKTTDGGGSWVTINTPVTTPILKVRSYNGQIVIASGFDGLILRSTDTGETFTQVTSGVTGDLWGLQMINDTLGWACGNANSLIKTTDGGESWQTVPTPGYTSDYWWIDFLNENYGFIAANGKVLRTTDGGQNWDIIQAGDSYPLFSIDVIDSLHIAAAGYGGTGYRGKNIYSSDGGYTWVNGGPTTFDPINCIKYVSPDTGYITMSEVGLWRTTNRGQEWTLLDSIPLSNIGEYELQFFKEANIGYDAGSGLKLYKADGNLDVWNRLIINDNFSDVFFVDEQKGFIISSALYSSYNALYKTTDGGNNWNIVPNAPSGNRIYFLNSLIGFIGNYTIFKTEDGGENWYPTSIVTTGEITKIFFIDSTVGWATSQWSPSSNSKILKTTDGGESWFVQVENGIDAFTSIYFIDSLNGWATSRYIWQTTDGGENWIERTDIAIDFSDDVYFPNLDTGWVARHSSINTSLFKTTDGGLNWLEIPEILGASSFYLFPDESHWLITGSIIQSYVIYKKYITYDGGNNWIDISNEVPVGFSGFSAVNNSLGFAVGSSGLILRYDDTTYVPVELILFQGKLENNKILLKWITATELNNYGFEILRSTDLINWETRGFVAGNGTTIEQNIYIFYDTELLNDHYYYKIKQIDFDGSYNFSESIEVKILINYYSLSQNYPNPANPTTNITFTLPQKSYVKINLYSINGELVKQIISEEKERGIYNLELNISNFASGVYFYRMITNTGYHSTKKLIILK